MLLGLNRQIFVLENLTCDHLNLRKRSFTPRTIERWQHFTGVGMNLGERSKREMVPAFTEKLWSVIKKFLNGGALLQ